MTGISRGKVFLQLAALTFAIIVVVGVVLGLQGRRIIGDRIREGAATAAVDTIQPPLEAALGGVEASIPLNAALSQRLDAATASLISDQTVLVRLWSRQGTVVFSTREGEIGRGFVGQDELQRALKGDTVPVVASGAASPEEAPAPEQVMHVYTPMETTAGSTWAVLEVAQDYAPTGALIGRASTAFYLALAGGLALVWLLFQGAAWSCTSKIGRQYGHLVYLFRVGQQLRSSLDLSEVAAQTARDATILAQSQFGFVCLLEGNTQELVLKATYDHEKGSVGYHNSKIDDTYLLRVVATGEGLSARLPERPLRAIFGIRAFEGPAAVATVPIRIRDRVIGVAAAVRHPSVQLFSRGELAPLQELAEQAAMAIEQAGLFSKVRAYASELELSYDTTLRALMAALDTKDSATEGHSERVSRLTVAVAREMGLPDNRMPDIERGALLHDVGKIGVPDSILRKPNTLTRREWEAMQKHPLLAGLMVSKVGFLEGALPILLYHHERYDGSGYPFGLVADKIPLEARIFAIVDAYDAITSDRPYRKAASPEDALREIRANAGVQFDPQVVDAFETVIRRLLIVEEDTQAA